MNLSANDPVRIGIFYAHTDHKHLAKLVAQLAPLRREGLIEDWYDGRMLPGDAVHATIARRLESTQLFLLLLSPDFFRSDYCWDKEMKRAIERNNAGAARVLPIVTRAVDWQHSVLGALQSLPRSWPHVTAAKDRDRAWMEVAQGIRLAVTEIRNKRGQTSLTSAAPVSISPPAWDRRIYDAQCRLALPGRLVRAENDPPTGDIAVDETFDSIGAVCNFLWSVFGRDFINDRGTSVAATVHYGRLPNAFWNGSQLISGDGDGELFGRLSHLDIVAKELMSGALRHSCRMAPSRQAPALRDSFESVCAVLVKQHALGQSAERADWQLGSDAVGPRVFGRAFISLSNPGYAYNNEIMGRDPQVSHMRDYDRAELHPRGIYANSGILNLAFFKAASELRGYAWEKAGQIWYQAIHDRGLIQRATFENFAGITIRLARGTYGEGSPEHMAVEHAWSSVGVTKWRPRSRSAGDTSG